MPWLHRSKKANKPDAGDASAAKPGNVSQSEGPPPAPLQQQQQQQTHDELQLALNNVLEALQILNEKHQPLKISSPSAAKDCHHQDVSASNDRSKTKKKQQPQSQPKDPPSACAEYGDTFQNLQHYLSQFISRGQPSTEAAPIDASIMRTDSTFATDQLDPPSSASRLRRRNYRPTRRERMPPEADLVSGLTSEDLQASEGSRNFDENDQTRVSNRSRAGRGQSSSTTVRRCCQSKVSEICVILERARVISSSLLQQPATVFLGCSVSQRQQLPAVLLISQAAVAMRPPAIFSNIQLLKCDGEACSRSSQTTSPVFDEESKVATEPKMISDSRNAKEVAMKSVVDCSAVPVSTALNTCADGDTISETRSICCSATQAAAESVNHDDHVSSDDQSDDEDGDDEEPREETGKNAGRNSNNSFYRNGCCGHRSPSRQSNPIQIPSVVESKLLERACESFPPAEVELVRPSSSNTSAWDPPGFGKVEAPPEPTRPAEPIGRADQHPVVCGSGSGGRNVESQNVRRSSSTMRSATTLEVLDNVNDDVGSNVEEDAAGNEEATASVSCCTYDIGKSSGFTQLLMTLDRAHRRLEGLPPSPLPPPSGDAKENPSTTAAPPAPHQQHFNKQRASVQTLNKMLLRSPFVSRREPSPPPKEKQLPIYRQQSDHPAAMQPGCWTYQTMHQQMSCQQMLPAYPNYQSADSDQDRLVVTTATSLMTLSQSLQRCVLQIEAAVSRLNGNTSG